jgi:RNA polymerase sigma factor (sigma-70 family)
LNYYFYICIMEKEQLDIIIHGVKQNNVKYQNMFYKIYGDYIYNLIRKFYVDDDTIKDIRQEIFLKVYTNIHKYDNIGSFQGWLGRVTKNYVYDQKRKGKKSIIEEYGDQHENVYTERQELFDYDYDKDVKIKEIINLSKDLSKSYGLIFKLYFLEGMTHKEISKKLNISEGASKSNLHKAKKKIKEKIKIC